MIKVLAVIALLSVAQILPSCGGRQSSTDESTVGGSQPQVIGWIDEKRTRVWETTPHMIVINQQEYGVPYEFWLSVDIGDLVKYQDGRWSIVRRARS